MLSWEDLAKELPPLRVMQQELPLWAYVPQTPKGFDCSAETWVLNGDGPRVPLDLVPQVISLAPESAGLRRGGAGRRSDIYPAW